MRNCYFECRVTSGSTARTYSLRRVPQWLHPLVIDLLKWRVAIIDVRGRRRDEPAERAALREAWDRR